MIGNLERLARQLQSGEISLSQFLKQSELFESTRPEPRTPDNAVTLDLDRHRRCGYPEVVFAEGKEIEAIESIFHALLKEEQPVLSTRVSFTQGEQLTSLFPQGKYNERAKTFRIGGAKAEGERARVAIVSAGTSDRPVAEEARETLDWMGINVSMIADVGVAGPHRLPERIGEMESAAAVIVVAGMEGALPSVVGGYLACPVIAVPTSVGYGASLGGIAALLSMLNSCAANVSVVNIDAGFKAGYVAGLIARQSAHT